MDAEAPIEAVEAPVAPVAAAPDAPPCLPESSRGAEIEQRLAAIEAEAAKWLGGRHALITRHVAELRKLLK